MSSPIWLQGWAAVSPASTRPSTRRSAPMPALPAIRMTSTADRYREHALYRLLAWISPSFPTGAFSYSHGLEAAAAAGELRDRASLEAWIATIIAHGSGRIDADILC